MDPFRILIALPLALIGCDGTISKREPEVFRILGVPDGTPALEAAGRITQRYLEERRYLKVAFPGLADATEEQERTALSLAVPQPAFRENNPMGPAYIGCMIHEPVREAAAAMARRCESEMRDIASSLGLSLAPRAGW
jgi:hypothetical protein